MAELAAAIIPAVITGGATLIPKLIDLFTPDKHQVNVASLIPEGVFMKQSQFPGTIAELTGSTKLPFSRSTTEEVIPETTPSDLGGKKKKKVGKPKREKIRKMPLNELKELLANIGTLMLTEKQDVKAKNVIAKLIRGSEVNEKDMEMIKKLVVKARRQKATV